MQNSSSNWQLKNILPKRRTIRSIMRAARAYFFGKRGQRRIEGLRLFYRVRLLVLLWTNDQLGKIARRWEARVWIDGTNAFDRIEKLIGRAKHTVFIQMFIWKEDGIGRRIAGALIAAADRGVEITIRKEATADVFELSKDLRSTKESNDPLWQSFWNHPRITIEYTSDDNHAKVYVIDGEILLLSGMNIADEYTKWHDYLVELRGSSFVNKYLNPAHAPLSGPVQLVMNSKENRETRIVIENLIHNAKHSVVVVHGYLSDPDILKLLAQKSHEGVSVTVLFSETSDVHHFANMQSAEYLLNECNPQYLKALVYPGFIHGKLLLVDREHLCVGSANLVPYSLDKQGEVNVLIHGKYRRSIQKIRDSLRADILKSRPLTVPPSISWIGRILAMIGL